jgi:hypothetical protein
MLIQVPVSTRGTVTQAWKVTFSFLVLLKGTCISIDRQAVKKLVFH